MTFVYCLLALGGVYIVFVLAPSVVMYKAVFRRIKGKQLTDTELKGTRYEPFASEIADDFRFFEEAKYEKVSINAADGAVLTGRLYPVGGNMLAICFHGYGSTAENCFFATGRYLISRGYDLLLVSQRAHNDSGGDCPTLGVLEQYDVQKWAEWADGREETEKILLAGVSMGCASVAYASDKIQSKKVKAMLLNCGYVSPYEQLTEDCRSRKLPAKLIVPVIHFLFKHLKNINIKTPVWKSLENTEIPALFIHGTADETVPFSDTEINYEHCASPKELYAVEGAYHTLAFPKGGKAAETVLGQFLGTYVERESEA